MSATAELETLIQQARQCLRQGNLRQAAELYEQAVAQNADNIAAHEGLATTSFMMQNYDRAIELFRRVQQLDPRRAQPLVNIGAIHNRRNEFLQASKVLRQALSKDRKCAEAYYNLGIAHKGLNQLSMAVSAYREAIRLSPEMAEAYQNLANVYVEMGNTQQAIQNYRRALELRPDFERARRGLEKAQNVVAEARQSASPFGRLVRIEEAKVAQKEERVRVLTPQERFEDRLAIHGHSKDLERAAAVVLNELRDQLEPALRALTQEFLQADGRYHFLSEFAEYQRAIKSFKRVVEALETSSDKLRAHEQFIRS